MKNILKQLTFFDQARRQEKVDQFDKLRDLNELIPWESLRYRIREGMKRSESSLGGRPPFDEIKMFKILILQRLYNLSDDQTEYRLNDSFSFQRFVGIGNEEAVPDAKTIWHYRETLTKSGSLGKIFVKFNKYLSEQGYQAREGTIVDATIVSVPKKKLCRENYQQVKQGLVPEGWNKNEPQRRQMDTDARITIKRGKFYYGYKNHINVDAKHKLISSYTVTDASRNECMVIKDLISKKTAGTEKKHMWGDSAYDTRRVREYLAAEGITAMVQKQRRGPGMPKDKYAALNSSLSKVRKRVEHVFAYQVTVMKAASIRCVGILRAEGIIILNNLTYNMMRYKFLSS
jgi:IS5 family transposase